MKNSLAKVSQFCAKCIRYTFAFISTAHLENHSLKILLVLECISVSVKGNLGKLNFLKPKCIFLVWPLSIWREIMPLGFFSCTQVLLTKSEIINIQFHHSLI